MPSHPPHVQRMIDELAQLNDRITKAEEFTTGPVYRRLAEIDQTLLRAQLCSMKTYGALLSMRITRATD